MRTMLTVAAATVALAPGALVADHRCEEAAVAMRDFFPNQETDLGPVSEAMSEPAASAFLITAVNIGAQISITTAMLNQTSAVYKDGEMFATTVELMDCGEYLGWSEPEYALVETLKEGHLRVFYTMIANYVTTNGENAE